MQWNIRSLDMKRTWFLIAISVSLFVDDRTGYCKKQNWNKVIVELKALINLEDVHLAQAKNYLVAYKFKKKLLINFGATSLQYKLIFNPTLNSENYQFL